MGGGMTQRADRERAMSKARKPTEEQFLEAVVELAHYCHWRVYHALPARTDKGWRTLTMGDVGFPDLCMARHGEIVFAELKVDGREATPAQLAWLTELANERASVLACVWTPDDWPEIERVLTRR